ncbi:MAG TPA: hypothetical protein V6C76_14520 [Drouetiella sp.]
MTSEDSNVRTGIESLREKQANELPFILRAWWLRKFLESEGLIWPKELGVTSALWSLHSDPLCDVGSVDQHL